jgi:hypothetical protein
MPVVANIVATDATLLEQLQHAQKFKYSPFF